MPPLNGKIRVLIAAKERGVRDHIRQLVLSDEKYEIAATAIDGQEAVQLAVLHRPNVVLLNAELPIFNGFEAAEMISLAAPEVHTVLMGNRQPDSQDLKKAMMSGLRAYIPSPLVEAEFYQTLERLSRVGEIKGTPAYQTATDPALLPKLIVVTGGKGGIGKTTIATSLATYLAQQNPGKVVLFDLYTQFGDIATVLNISPQKSLCDLVASSEEIDLDLLEAYMTEHVTGLKVLVSATGAQPIDAISVSDAENTIHALKRAYTHIVVDLPPILHATTLYVLSHCYQLMLVTTLFDMPTVRNAKELYDRLVGTYVAEEKIVLVANRVSKYDKLSFADVERTFSKPISARVPNDPRLVSAVNQGVPFLKAYSRSPLVGAIENIAKNIVNQQPGSEN